jgi:tartrate-resistant acid phosphatase type 5
MMRILRLYIAVFLPAVLLPLINCGQQFAIVSDIHGASANTLEVSKLIKSWNPEFIITCGDNYYPSVDSIDHQIGQFYHDYIDPYPGSYGQGDTVNSFFPALGNHDFETGNISEYLSYFTLPNNERYYDLVKGNVHLFAIDCYASEPDGTSDTSVQAMWLKDKLALSTSLYNIVYFHYPPYSSGMHGSTPGMQWPFKEWGATAVFSGHDHYYERLIIDGFPYFVDGAGGGPTYTTYNAIPGSQIHYSFKHGAIYAVANSDSITFRFINVSDSVVDQYSIPKKIYGIPESSAKNDLVLSQNNPNPFNTATEIDFYLGRAGKVDLRLYDILGQETDVMLGETFSGGPHKIVINADDLHDGIYFYSISFEDKITVKKAMVNK